MADVYEFNVKLDELENYIWREIEITSVSSVAKLAYSILAAFESSASHLFNLRHDNQRYEILFEEDDFDDDPAIDPTTSKLNAHDLQMGDKLSMEYDYGAGWEFEIELIAITQMKRGTGTHYPYVTDGKGKGILEDTSPYELLEIVDQTDNEGIFPKILERYTNKEVPWDYREFDIEDCNFFSKIVFVLSKWHMKNMNKS